MIRWPGKIPAGVGLQRDRPAPRLAADVPRRRRRPDVVEKLRQGHEVGDKTFKVHIDGYNLLPYLTGEVDESPRKGFIYFSDDGDLRGAALRQLEDRVHGAARAGHARRSGPSRSSPLRVPKLFNLRTDPFERADITSNTYWDWCIDNGLPDHGRARRIVAEFLETFKEFPPRQKAASFTIDQAVEKLTARAAADAASHRRRLDCRAGAADMVPGSRAATFTMGSDGTTPRRRRPTRSAVDGFWIDRAR